MKVARHALCFVGFLAVAVLAGADAAEPAAKSPPQPLALSAADRSLLEGLFKQFLFDPKGAQCVRVKMTRRTVWMQWAEVQRDRLAGVRRRRKSRQDRLRRRREHPGRRPRIASRNWTSSPSAASGMRSRRRGRRGPTTAKRPFAKCSRPRWATSKCPTSRWPPGSIAWNSRRWRRRPWRRPGNWPGIPNAQPQRQGARMPRSSGS